MKESAYKVLEDVLPIKVGKKNSIDRGQQARFMEFVSCHGFLKYHQNLFTYLFGTGCQFGRGMCIICFSGHKILMTIILPFTKATALFKEMKM